MSALRPILVSRALTRRGRHSSGGDHHICQVVDDSPLPLFCKPRIVGIRDHERRRSVVLRSLSKDPHRSSLDSKEDLGRSRPVTALQREGTVLERWPSETLSRRTPSPPKPTSDISVAKRTIQLASRVPPRTRAPSDGPRQGKRQHPRHGNSGSPKRETTARPATRPSMDRYLHGPHPPINHTVTAISSPGL